jgi:hypothetical protein
MFNNTIALSSTTSSFVANGGEFSRSGINDRRAHGWVLVVDGVAQLGTWYDELEAAGAGFALVAAGHRVRISGPGYVTEA